MFQKVRQDSTARWWNNPAALPPYSPPFATWRFPAHARLDTPATQSQIVSGESCGLLHAGVQREENEKELPAPLPPPASGGSLTTRLVNSFAAGALRSCPANHLAHLAHSATTSAFTTRRTSPHVPEVARLAACAAKISSIFSASTKSRSLIPFTLCVTKSNATLFHTFDHSGW